MHLLIAREAVDRHLAVAGDIIDPEAPVGRKAKAFGRASLFYARWLPTLAVGRGRVPRGYASYGPLARHVRYVERAARKMARMTFAGMTRWQGAMERKQAYLGRIVDIGAELFAMSAACVRAQAERDTRPDGVELADIFCRQSRHRVEALFHALWHNTDSRDVALARKLLDGRYAALEQGVLTPTEGPWVAGWETGESTVDDVRRRLTVS
jgi:hypothetical protein